MILELIVFILILSFLIFIHEFFHFLAAKRANVKVEEFGFGLPPRIFGKKIGETIYSINLLPFGGFVRLYGEDRYQEVEKERSFISQKPLVKAKILLAGVTANFLLAILFFYIVLGLENFSVFLPSLFGQKFLFGEESQYIVVGNVAENSPAQRDGIKPYDLIISANGKKINNPQDFVEFVHQQKGKEIVLEVKNLKEGEKRQIKTTPREHPPKGQGPLGVAISTIVHLEYKSLSQKIFSGFLHSLNILDYSFKLFGRLIKVSFEKKTIQPIAESVSGPVGIFFLVKITLKEGVGALLNLIALLSLSLGLINILPIPATDGGRLIFVLYEALFKKPIPEKIERNFNLAGYIVLILLLFLITFKDIRQFLIP